MRLLLIAAVCLLHITALSQGNYRFESHIGWRGNGVELHTIPSKDQRQHCLFLASPDSLRAWLMVPGMKPIATWAIPRRSGEQILGGFMRGDNIHLFTQKSFEKGLHAYSFNKATGDNWEFTVPFDPEKERVVERVSAGDHFLYLTVNKKTAEFVIYDFTSDSNYTSFRHHFGEGVWQELTSPGLFKRAINAEKIDMPAEPPVEAVQCANKLYVQGDTLHLLMNNDPGLTRAFQFDLRRRQVLERNIFHQTGVPATGTSVKFNSYLLGDKLFYVQATFDSLWLHVSDFRSGNVVRRFSAGRDNDISFRNTAIVQEGSAWGGANDTRELGKTRQLLRKMVNGRAAIMAVPVGGQLVVTVASYAAMSGGSGWYWTGGAGGAPMWVPSGAFTHNSWAASARFRLLLNNSTLEHTKGEPGAPVNDWAANFAPLRGLKVSPEAENLFRNSGRYYYACYDKKERRLIVDSND